MTKKTQSQQPADKSIVTIDTATLQKVIEGLASLQGTLAALIPTSTAQETSQTSDSSSKTEATKAAPTTKARAEKSRSAKKTLKKTKKPAAGKKTTKSTAQTAKKAKDTENTVGSNQENSTTNATTESKPGFLNKINSLSDEELTKALEGIKVKTEVIEAILKAKPFQTINELSEIKGLGRKTVEKIKTLWG